MPSRALLPCVELLCFRSRHSPVASDRRFGGETRGGGGEEQRGGAGRVEAQANKSAMVRHTEKGTTALDKGNSCEREAEIAS